MRRIAILGITAVAALAPAGSAEAAATTRVTTYGDVEFTAGIHVAFGQVFAGKKSCVENRKVMLVAKPASGKAKTLDIGRTSSDGAISGGYLSSQAGAGQIRFIAPKTKKCGGASADVVVQLRTAAERKPVGTSVVVLGAGGAGSDGAFAGLLGLSERAKCFAGRKVSLYGEKDLLDHGTTTANGTWAMHLTSSEAVAYTKFKVKVAEGEAPNGTRCAGGSTTFAPGT